ncbi:hypothetical protein B9Z51_10775 [Limnohabitans sp. T6-5]|uniref:DUF4259 domain-containing protein n=1 Tax=Limnohabitans sp. T6-5 TaxID=1100724 RepID=UPI000D39F90A|nr:DUF4259 domain-containing protein [Limnohabitans sp. T6-5]PUE09357.1 hypothetical protein B9Z51_10775 [Limnohabitans sp. T6-5]
MGTWSFEPFGNDFANDWAYELDETKDLRYIEQALDAITAEVPPRLFGLEEEAVAAAEVLAKVLGKGTQSEERIPVFESFSALHIVDEWVAALKERPSSVLVEKARQMMELILAGDPENPEKLWLRQTREEDPEELAEWSAIMNKLIAALTLAPPTRSHTVFALG